MDRGLVAAATQERVFLSLAIIGLRSERLWPNRAATIDHDGYLLYSVISGDSHWDTRMHNI
ncbi:hypothetical protein [Paenibacillus sp. TY11]|uniref:hypothetical protein n=1 Tax=Paenibacillus sp. TY11 TaxID=3448633 RepID=UPI00403A2926